MNFLRPAAIAALAVGLAWLAGGQALLGRIDPALALPILPVPLLLLAWWQRGAAPGVRRRDMLAALLALALAQGALAALLAAAPGWPQLALIFACGGLAALSCDALVQRRLRRRWAAMAGAGLVVGWFIAAHLLLAVAYRPAMPASTAAVTMLSALPLRWSQEGDMTAMIARGTHDDAALKRIEAAGPLSFVDSLADQAPTRDTTLFLAHPPALAPRELVAIDRFVRDGGRAVVLADALSGWPPPYPLGDRRNPPVTSLLTPLLDHWGIVLGAAPIGKREAVDIDVEGKRLRLFSAGRFDRLPPACQAFGDRRVARCRIGEGEAWLVGDADLLFAPLWQPVVAGASHLRRADTMEWLDARLRGRGAGHAPFEPLWIDRG